MRLVMRVLLFESALSWLVVLAGWIRVVGQVWPFAVGTLKAGFRGRAWRVGLGLLVAAGWPVPLSLVIAKHTPGDWLKVAALWWVLTGALGCLLLVAKGSEAASDTDRGTGCRCGTCTARGL
jgi:hypothetical protein